MVSKKPRKGTPKEEGGMNKTQQIFEEGCGVELIQKDITRVVHLVKYS